MSGADGDEDAGFSNFESAEPVDDENAMDSELFVDVRGDFLDLGDGHGFVRFVFEIEGAAVSGMVADEPVEDDHGAICALADMAGKNGGIYGSVNKLDFIGGRRRHRRYVSRRLRAARKQLRRRREEQCSRR